MTVHDVVDLHRRSVERFAELAHRVGADQWALATPCSGWDVRQLVNHLVSEERWTAPLMSGATVAEVGDRFEGDLLGPDPAAAAAAASKEAADAVSEPGAVDRTVHLSFGDFPGAEYASQLFADHLVHTWDLAKAIGADDRLESDLVSACATWYDAVEDMYRQYGAVGPRVPLPRDAGDQARLLARFGRDAAWTHELGLVQRFGEAFSRRDVDALMTMTTEDVVFESTNPAPDGVRFEGRVSARAAWERLFAETGDLRFEAEETVVLGDRGVVRWCFSWSEPDGSDGHVRGVDVLRLSGGKVAEKLSYVKG